MVYGIPLNRFLHLFCKKITRLTLSYKIRNAKIILMKLEIIGYEKDEKNNYKKYHKRIYEW